MGNRVVSTKLTDEEHQKLIDACGIAGQSPSAFIRGLIQHAVSTQPFSQGDTAQARGEQTVPKEEQKESAEDGATSKKIDGITTSVETLMAAIERDRRRKTTIKERNLKHGDELDGQIVSHCPSCNELH